MPISFVHPNNTRAEGFRYVYANTVGVQFMGPDGILTFSVFRNPADDKEGAEEQVAIGMNAPAIKALAITLSRVIENFEKAAGSEIPTNPELTASLDKMVVQPVKK